MITQAPHQQRVDIHAAHVTGRRERDDVAAEKQRCSTKHVELRRQRGNTPRYNFAGIAG